MSGFVTTWSVTPEQMAEDLDKYMGKLVRDLARNIFNEIVELTPVRTGSAHASWRASVDTVDDTVTVNEDANNPIPGASFPTSFPTELIYDNIYISNALPYINRLEHGWSKQAPNGMVQVVLDKYGL